MGAVDRVAAHLNRVLSGAHDRGANTVARRHDRPGKRVVSGIMPQRLSQRRAEIVERPGLLAIDVLADATGKDNRVVTLRAAKRRGQPKLLEPGLRLLVPCETQYGTGHVIGQPL